MRSRTRKAVHLVLSLAPAMTAACSAPDPHTHGDEEHVMQASAAITPAPLAATTRRGDSIGVYRPSTGKFYLRNRNTSGNTEIEVTLPNIPTGQPTDPLPPPPDPTSLLPRMRESSGGTETLDFIGQPAPIITRAPVVGDWDHDGVDTVGLYVSGIDPSTPNLGIFYLGTSNTSPSIVTVSTSGSPGDLPFAGGFSSLLDRDSVGLYRPSTGEFFMPDHQFLDPIAGLRMLGNPSRVPFAGNWLHEREHSLQDYGTPDTLWDSPAEYDPVTCTLHATTRLGDGLSVTSDLHVKIDNAPCTWQTKPVKGNWTGKHDGFGVFHNGKFYLRYDMSSGPYDQMIEFGQAGDLPIAGRWTKSECGLDWGSPDKDATPVPSGLAHVWPTNKVGWVGEILPLYDDLDLGTEYSTFEGNGQHLVYIAADGHARDQSYKPSSDNYRIYWNNGPAVQPMGPIPQVKYGTQWNGTHASYVVQIAAGGFSPVADPNQFPGIAPTMAIHYVGIAQDLCSNNIPDCVSRAVNVGQTIRNAYQDAPLIITSAEYIVPIDATWGQPITNAVCAATARGDLVILPAVISSSFRDEEFVKKLSDCGAILVAASPWTSGAASNQILPGEYAPGQPQYPACAEVPNKAVHPDGVPMIYVPTTDNNVSVVIGALAGVAGRLLDRHHGNVDIVRNKLGTLAVTKKPTLPSDLPRIRIPELLK